MKLLAPLIPLVLIASAAAENGCGLPHPVAISPHYPVVTYAAPCPSRVVVPSAAWHPAPVVVCRPARVYRSYGPTYSHRSSYRPSYRTCRPTYAYRPSIARSCYRAPRVVVFGSGGGGCSPGYGW